MRTLNRFGSHKGTKTRRRRLGIHDILAPPAQRAVLDNLGQMPPATTAFVVGGFSDMPADTSTIPSNLTEIGARYISKRWQQLHLSDSRYNEDLCERGLIKSARTEKFIQEFCFVA